MNDEMSAVFDDAGRCAHDLVDAALGAMLGVFVGDACGAPLEKLGAPPSAAQVDDAMQLQSSRSQPTDDSEMATALLLGFADCLASAAPDQFDVELVARRYATWVRSNPIDCG